MRNKQSKWQAIAVSICVGIGMLIILPLVLAPVLRQPAWLYLPIFMGCFFVAGFALSLIWSRLGWQVGLWLFIPWPPVLLLGEFLSADKPWNWKGDLLSLGAYALMLIAACFGGWFGAFINTRRTKRDYNPNGPSLQARP